MNAPLLAAVAVSLVACAALRGPAPVVSGPTLTIHNEGHELIDLSYRCIENGPTRRLGTVTPRSSTTFTLRPAFCSTVYLVGPSLGPFQAEGTAFAVVPLLGQATEIVFTATGHVARRDPAPRRAP